jgi:hypothetical protein
MQLLAFYHPDYGRICTKRVILESLPGSPDAADWSEP